MENRKRIASRWTESEARGVLAQWRSSGESLAEFARRRGVQQQRLAWWLKRLGSVAAPAFLPVAVRGEVEWPVVGAAVAIDAAGDVRVELRALDAASAEWVALLSRSLRSGS